MATAFTQGPIGLVAAFAPDELRLLLALAEDLATMLEPSLADDPLGIGLLAEASLSRDPVLARLLPNAYANDDEASDEFRRLTEHGLRTTKSAALVTMATGLRDSQGHVALDQAQANAWLSGLNDLRLAIGTRMGMGADDALPQSHASLEALYDWLTWMQDGLIAAIGDVADTLAP